MIGQHEKDTYTYKAAALSPLTSGTYSTHESSDFVNASSQNYIQQTKLHICTLLTIGDYEPLIHRWGPWGT